MRRAAVGGLADRGHTGRLRDPAARDAAYGNADRISHDDARADCHPGPHANLHADPGAARADAAAYGCSIGDAGHSGGHACADDDHRGVRKPDEDCAGVDSHLSGRYDDHAVA